MSNELDSLMMQADLANKEAREAGTHGHTPGPWSVEWKSPCYWLVRYDGVHLPPSGSADCPNRRLIAAAPELLAALKRTLSMANGHAADARGISPGECRDFPWAVDAQAAIDNATAKEEA